MESSCMVNMNTMHCDRVLLNDTSAESTESCEFWVLSTLLTNLVVVSKAYSWCFFAISLVLHENEE